MDIVLICIYYASIAFGIFSALYYTTNIYLSGKFKHSAMKSNEYPKNVTIIIPVYKEEIKSFSETLKAATSQGAQVIVFGDGCEEPYKSVSIKSGAVFRSSKNRGGKRAALSQAIHFVKTKYVMFLDSDTIIPKDAVVRMLSRFGPKVGGVCPNIHVKKDHNVVSYCAEFLERTKEIMFRALSFQGNAMILTGQCSMYKTTLIRDFVGSKDFSEFKIFGASFGDDRQLTNFVLKKGYKAVQDFDVRVFTAPQKTFTNLLRQQMRWTKTGYAFLFREMLNGTFWKRGFTYAIDNLYIYTLPIFTLVLLLFYSYFLFLYPGFFYSKISAALNALIHIYVPGNLSIFLNSVSSIVNKGIPHIQIAIIINLIVRSISTFALLVFFAIVILNIKKEKTRTVFYGALVLLAMFILSLYTLLTLWKKQRWSTRQ